MRRKGWEADLERNVMMSWESRSGSDIGMALPLGQLHHSETADPEALVLQLEEPWDQMAR